MAIRSRSRSGGAAPRRRRLLSPRRTATRDDAGRMLESARIQGGASRLAIQEKTPEGLEDLVARVRAGDPRAEERIVELYGRGVAVIRVLHRARQRYKELLTARLGGDRMAQVAGQLAGAIILLLITLWWREHLGGGA